MDVKLGDLAQLASAGGLGAMAWYFVVKLHPELVRIREVMSAVLEHLRKEKADAEPGYGDSHRSGAAPTRVEEEVTERQRRLRRVTPAPR